MSVSTQADQTIMADFSAVLHCRVLPTGEATSAAELAARVGFPECGAVVTFEGVVRLTEDDHQLLGLEYDFHPVMAETELHRVCVSALEKFQIEQLACEHRTGFVPVQVASVAIAVGAAHRRAAFEACQYILDELKTCVPIWKSPVYFSNHTRSSI